MSRAFTFTLLFLLSAVFLYGAMEIVGPNSVTASTVTISVDPSTSEAEVNQTFMVNIIISDVIDLYGWEFKLRWNSTLLEAINVTEGTFLKGDKETFFVSNINNTLGYMLVDCSLIGDVPGVSGDGILATVEFYVKTWGECILSLYYTKLVSSLEQPITHTITDGIVKVIKAPVASFTCSPSPAIVSETITFNASTSTPNGGTIVSYFWNFGDGTTANVTSIIVTHTYLSFGNYTVTLTVKDSEGLTNSCSKVITIIDYPTADFTYSLIYPIAGEPVTFDASTSTPNGGTIVSYFWDFGDGNITITYGSIITHVYSSEGTYNVTLMICDSEGLTDSASLLITILPLTHDIAINLASAYQNVVGQVFCTYIYVTVENQGGYMETFDLMVYANLTLIQTQKVTLTHGNSTTPRFTWNTTGIAKGNYRITATATPINNETDTTDNTYVDGWILISIIGDITSSLPDVPDGKVDMHDVAAAAKAFGSYPSDPRWNPNTDVSGSIIGMPDYKVNMKDIATIAKHFGDIDP